MPHKAASSADLMDLRLQVQQLSSAVSTQQQQVQSQMRTIQQLKAQLELQGELATGCLPPDMISSAGCTQSQAATTPKQLTNTT